MPSVTVLLPNATLSTPSPDYTLDSAGAPTKHEALQAVTTLGDFIFTSSAGATDAFGMSTPGSIPANAIITHVTFFANMGSTATFSNIITVSAIIGANSWSTLQTLTGSFAMYNYNLINDRPGGGEWTPADFNATGGNVLTAHFEHMVGGRTSRVTYAAFAIGWILPALYRRYSRMRVGRTGRIKL